MARRQRGRQRRVTPGQGVQGYNLNYDYGPGGGITEDFGSIATGVLEQSQKTLEIEDARKKEMAKAQEEANKANQHPHTGIASMDEEAQQVTKQGVDALYEIKSKVGQYDEELGRVVTVEDQLNFANNIKNNALVYKGNAEWVKAKLEEYEKDEDLSPAVIDAFTSSVGAKFQRGEDGRYNTYIDSKGNFMMSTPKGGETDLKVIGLNGMQRVEKFDSTADIADFQKVYAETRKEFEIDGQMYDAQTVLANPVLFTKHVTQQSEDFDNASKQYVENFASDDNKVIDYLYKMGKQIGQGDGDIRLDGKGGFIISDGLRKEAKDAFKKEVDGAFGKKEEGKAQIMRMKPKPTAGPRSKDFDNMSIGGSSSQTFSTDRSFSLKTFDTQSQSTKTASFGAQDIVYNGLLKTAGMSADPEEKARGLMEETVANAFGPGNPIIPAAALTAMNDSSFHDKNTDLYVGKTVRNIMPTTEEMVQMMKGQNGGTEAILNSIKRGDANIESVSIGVDMSASDMEEIGLVGINGNALNGISGIAFTYERYKDDKVKEPEDPAKNGTLEELERQYPKRAIGVRFIGNGNVSSTKTLSESDPQLFGSEEVGALGTQKSTKKTAQLTTNLIQDDQIPQIVKAMSKKTPGFQRIFNESLSKNTSTAQALYDAINRMKTLQPKS